MSVIFDALMSIAEKTEEDERNLKLFTYSKEFDELWAIEEQVKTVLKNAQNQTTMVIVWDKTPSRGKDKYDAVDTSQYLTPIDWAVAFSLAVHNKVVSSKENSEAQHYPTLRILILDEKFRSITNAENGVKFVNEFPRRSLMAMPWVRLFRPWDEALFANIMNNATGDAKVTYMSEYANGRILDLGVIRNIWAANLTRPSTPGDHHAIANLVGPRILLANEPGSDSHVAALRSFMKALGLIPEKITETSLLSENNSWINLTNNNWQQRLSRFLKGENSTLNLTLLDDQYELGWGKVFCQAVGVTYEKSEASDSSGLYDIGRSVGKNVSVKASSVLPNSLLSKIDGEDKRFKLNIYSNSDKDTEILFLDLRLFSGKSFDEEIAFFKELIEKARGFIDRTNLPWPGFTNKEISEVENWLNKNRKSRDREDHEYIDALTFLPRLLALTDLSLPIVLFSSTGRREIAEKLKRYGNIITVFDKPRFTVDIPDDIAEQTKDKFIKAMESAIILLQGRFAIQELKRVAKQPNVTNIINDQEKYVEIFIDESGDVFEQKGFSKKHFLVGGLVIIHDKKEDAISLHNEMQKTSVDMTINGTIEPKKLVWCGKSRLPKRLSKVADEEAKLVKQLFPSITKVFRKHSLLTLPVVLRAEVSEGNTLNVLHNEHLDNLYLKLIKDLLDTIFYELLPWHLGRKTNLKCKVFVATRVRTKNNNENFTPTEIEELKENFAIFVNENSVKEEYFAQFRARGSANTAKVDMNSDKKSYYQSLTPTSFISIVSNVIHGRTSTDENRLKVVGALGVTLKNDDQEPKYCFRHAHYLADLVAHIDYISIDKKDRDVFQEIFPERMIDLFDNGFKAAMDASKHLEANDLVSALLSAHYAKNHHDMERYPESIIPKILSNVSQSLKDLNGDQFRQFVVSLEDWYENGTNAPPRKAQLENRYFENGIQKQNASQDGFLKNSKTVPRKIGLENGQGTPKSGGLEKEIITVIKVERTGNAFFPKLLCVRTNGEEVTVSSNQASKAKLSEYKIKAGDKLSAIIFTNKELQYARDLNKIPRSR